MQKIEVTKRYTTRSKKKVFIDLIEDDGYVHGVIKRASNGLDKKAIWFLDGRFVGKPIDYPLSLIEEELLVPEAFHIVNYGITNIEPSSQPIEHFDVCSIGRGSSLKDAVKHSISKLNKKWDLSNIHDDLNKWMTDNYSDETIETFRLREENRDLEGIENYQYKVAIHLQEKIFLKDLIDMEITD